MGFYMNFVIYFPLFVILSVISVAQKRDVIDNFKKLVIHIHIVKVRTGPPQPKAGPGGKRVKKGPLVGTAKIVHVVVL